MLRTPKQSSALRIHDWKDRLVSQGRGTVMKVLDPGHLYELTNLDTDQPGNRVERACFVKRIGDKYPGNKPPGWSGTITQEVLRALIDRTKYVDAQLDKTIQVSQDGHAHNRAAIRGMRQALRAFEVRAAEERQDWAAVVAILQTPEIELTPTCTGCGHVMCSRGHAP
jgi:hypothetical protein